MSRPASPLTDDASDTEMPNLENVEPNHTEERVWPVMAVHVAPQTGTATLVDPAVLRNANTTGPDVTEQASNAWSAWVTNLVHTMAQSPRTLTPAERTDLERMTSEYEILRELGRAPANERSEPDTTGQ